MSEIRLSTRLTIAAWRRHLGSGGGPLTESGAWRPGVLKGGLWLDLTAVEFAHLGALARILLLLDAAVRDGVGATVVLPTGVFGARDRWLADTGAAPVPDQFLRRAARQARSRAEARGFLRHSGFDDALRAPHWPPGAVTVLDAEGATAETPPTPATVPVDGGIRFPGAPQERRVLPFQWLHHDAGTGLGLPEALAGITRRLSDMGLPAADAWAITHALVVELVDNIGKHARVGPSDPPYALVAAILVNEGLYATRRTDLPRSGAALADVLREGGDRRVLDLLVGDSGTGLVARSASAPADEAGDAILAAFDRKHAAGVPVRREGNGLWRVGRLASGYRGLVQVTTAGTTAGKSYLDPDTEEHVFEGDQLVAPGTLVEASLLIAGTPEPVRGKPWRGRPASTVDDDGPMAVVPCDLDGADGIGDADRTCLRKAVRANNRAGVVVVVPVTPPRLSDSALKTALARVLDTVSAIPDQVPLAVVLPDAGVRILDLCVAGINSHEDAQSWWPAPRSAVLVMGATGTPRWCGGPARLRAVLDALTELGGALTHQVLRSRTGASEVAHQELCAWLGRYPHLLSVTDTGIALRVSPGDAAHAMRHWARGRLAETIRDAGPGVTAGHFRTPTLRHTNRWIRVRTLLDEVVGTATAGWVLARMVEERADLHGPENRAVARVVNTATEPLAGQLSECLWIGGRFYAMPGELDLDGVAVSEQVPQHAEVVLCADILSTENTVRRAAAAIAARQAVVVAVACVVDSRDHDRQIRIFNRDVPVVSLVSVDISAGPTPESPKPVDVDPLLLEPVRPRAARRAYLDEETLLGWLARDPDWLRLGHFDRAPRNRHFSAYLRFDRLLRTPAVATRMRDAVRGALDDTAGLWRAGLSADPFATCEIWYPEAPDDFSALLDLVGDALAADGRRVTHRRLVPRAVAGTRWSYPTALDVDAPPGAVVAVDAGSLTGNSIVQLIRLAVSAGATAVVVIVALNQLDDRDADAMLALSSMRPDDGGTPVPVQVRFLANSSLTGLSVRNCALCETRDRADEHLRTAPAVLRSHVRVLRERTRLRPLREGFGTPPTDLFDVPVNGTDLADYLRWRTLLDRALRVTEARQTVVDKLSGLTRVTHVGPGGTWSRANLVRLIAAEQQWLKLPPLRHAAPRALLGEVCATILDEPPTALAWLRAQAVMVIAAADPANLVGRLPRLLALTVDEPVMINQLLLECYRLTLRPAVDSPVDHDALRLCLDRCRDRLDELMVDDRDPASIAGHRALVDQMRSILDDRDRPAPTDPQEAWHRLRRDYKPYVEAHNMESILLRVRDHVEDLPGARPTPERTKEALADWDRCARHLGEKAMPNLPALVGILQGEYVADRIGTQEQRALVAVADGAGVAALHQVQNLLHEVTGQWLPTNPGWCATREELLRRLRWWHRVFMDPHADGEAPALLVGLVGSVPTCPADHVERLLATRAPGPTAHRGEPIGRTARVFCPGPLLEAVVAHALDNITHHAAPGGQRPRVEVDYRLGEHFLELLVRNTGTRPRWPAGRGLRALNERLRPFGGSLVGNAEDDEDWTFTANVTLPLWRGA
ncbi:hypothetical protein V5P93_003640 [Actinokineospora auranticolor]|uniref:hypothetical protein n=1 Tax=Actinokineospora auranticolor TaxID=155976 RepID=UPI0011B07C72|nr:hypothetical protein [Actinokineospora auranticolor]